MQRTGICCPYYRMCSCHGPAQPRPSLSQRSTSRTPPHLALLLPPPASPWRTGVGVFSTGTGRASAPRDRSARRFMKWALAAAAAARHVAPSRAAVATHGRRGSSSCHTGAMRPTRARSACRSSPDMICMCVQVLYERQVPAAIQGFAAFLFVRTSDVHGIPPVKAWVCDNSYMLS